VTGFLVAAALASCGEPAQHPEQSGQALTPAPPDLLVVVLDTVRADALAAYGNDRPTSPQLDALARRGVLFEDVTAPSSWTWPSHASLFTGQPPWVHGAHFVQPANADHQMWDLSLGAMRQDLPTLAGQLSEAGYTTVSLAANPMLAPEKGLTRGFDHAAHLQTDLAVLGEAVRVMQQVEGPLFLFVNLFVAHHPAKVAGTPWSQAHVEALKSQAVETALQPYLRLDPPGIELYGRPEGSDRNGIDRLRAGELVLNETSVTLLRDLYEGEVAVADDQLTPLVRGWDQWRRDGVIAVTSDHGEYFGEHGLWEHARTLHAPVLEVPLVLAGRGLPAGHRVSAPIELLDLTATLLALAGLETDAETLLDT
jgi:arylsulfatase A-like enzyme